MALPPIRFVTAPDGVKLAYAVYGSGPPLVWVANWLTHLELDWESPIWKHWMALFTRRHTLIRYDERGCGLSDWTDQGLNLDTWTSDLAVIVDAIGLERFDLLGVSQGGPVAVEYAVRNPERVKRLILCGTFARGQFLPEGRVEMMAGLIEAGWGASNPAFRQLFTSLFVPAATDAQRDWFNELQAKSTTPAIAAAIYRAIHALDVSERLALVRSPTLILHSRHDSAIPFAQGRGVAAAIPGARFVPLSSDHHILLEGTPAWASFCRELAAFIGAAESDEDAHATTGESTRRDGTGSAASGRSYSFGDYRVDTASREILKDGRPVPIEHRAFDLLVYLIDHRDRAISKDELQAAVWPAIILTESALTRCVMKARRAVGDDAETQAVIKTVHRHGYRFVARLSET